MQGVRWDNGGTVKAEDYNFFLCKRNENHQFGKIFFVYHKRVLRDKTVEYAGGRMSYIDLRGRWCNIIVLNVHAPSEEKSDDSKDSFYEELERVFDQFTKYHMKILLGHFSAKVGRENIFKTDNWE